MSVNHQTVRLARGRHRDPAFGVCVMELASMLADDPFSDRPPSASGVIAAFLRTYNDAIDDERRQDLYPLAALIVGTAGSLRVERGRSSRCLELASSLGAGPPGGRGGIESRSRRRRAWLRCRDPAAAVEEALAHVDGSTPADPQLYA